MQWGFTENQAYIRLINSSLSGQHTDVLNHPNNEAHQPAGWCVLLFGRLAGSHSAGGHPLEEAVGRPQKFWCVVSKRALSPSAISSRNVSSHLKKIQLYPRKNSSGQWIKTIHFKFPMYYNDSNDADCDVCFDMEGNFLPKRGTDETVVLLSRKAPV